MKRDARFQAECAQTRITFPPGAVWACCTDVVPHAVISGQHVLEQTFLLPVSAMHRPAVSPLRILERLLGRVLVEDTCMEAGE